MFWEEKEPRKRENNTPPQRKPNINIKTLNFIPFLTTLWLRTELFKELKNSASLLLARAKESLWPITRTDTTVEDATLL